MTEGGEVFDAEVRRARERWIADETGRVGTERAKFWGWTNTYTYTKSIGEQILASSGLRFTIVRPAIIESSIEYPFPGWNEGINTSAPLAWAVIQGLDTLPVGDRTFLDIIPVDQHRFLTAYGRDVDLPESALKFHGDTGLLELLSDNPNQIRRNHIDQVIEQRVLVALRDIEESGDTASGKKVEDRATGKGVHIRAALSRLARRGVIYEEDLGPGRGTLYRLIHHPPSSPSSHLVPNRDEPPSSPPFMGDGGGGGLDNPTTTGRGTNPK